VKRQTVKLRDGEHVPNRYPQTLASGARRALLSIQSETLWPITHAKLIFSSIRSQHSVRFYELLKVFLPVCFDPACAVVILTYAPLSLHAMLEEGGNANPVR
jgi:hypothetical protein